ncbi:MAG TPA: hypothetical protein VMF52_06680, partial [Steroidobacteraceae bacterium]|nr:hypothetical protein [Steroidobacteraceae bacterium]
MQKIIHTGPLARTSFLALALGATVASADLPPLKPIDSADSAARALFATEGAGGAALGVLDSVAFDTRVFMLRTLGWLGAQTTPAAVAAARRGISVPCPGGGSVLATLPKSGKQVLRLTWTACAYADGSFSSSAQGQGEAQLPSATFTPDLVLSLHLGTLGEDLVISSTSTEEPGYRSEQLLNLHIDGRLPMTRFLGVGIFTGNYDLTIDGKNDHHFFNPGQPDDPYNPPYDSVYQRHVDDMRLIGSVTHSEANTVLDERVNVRYGTFRQIGTGTNTPLPEDQWPSFSGQDLKVRRVLRVADASSTVWLDGDYRYQRGPFNECATGWYSYKTLVPLRQYDVFHFDGKDSGKVRVNNA